MQNTEKNFCQTCGRKYEEIIEEGYFYDGDDDDADQENDEDFWDDWDDDQDDMSLDLEPRSSNRRSSKKKALPTGGGEPTSVPTGSQTGKGDLQLIAEAIQIHEGWFPPGGKYPRGSTSYRNKNPGNLKFVGQREAIGKDERGFAIFPSVDAGKRALLADLGAKFRRNPNLTIEGLISVYAPSSDNNNEQAYVNFIKKYISENK